MPLIQPIQISAKTNGELADAAERDVVGEVVGRLRHDGHVHEVVEQLQEADGSLRDRLAMWSRRAPQPAPETAGEPLVGHRVNVAIGSFTKALWVRWP